MGFRALKKTLESLYTTKVNNRVRTTRGTTLTESWRSWIQISAVFFRCPGPSRSAFTETRYHGSAVVQQVQCYNLSSALYGTYGTKKEQRTWLVGTLCIAQISQRVLSSLLAVGRVRLRIMRCGPGLRLDEVGQPALGRRGGRGDGARELGRAGSGGVGLEARRDAAEQRGAWGRG